MNGRGRTWEESLLRWVVANQNHRRGSMRCRGGLKRVRFPCGTKAEPIATRNPSSPAAAFVVFRSPPSPSPPRGNATRELCTFAPTSGRKRQHVAPTALPPCRRPEANTIRETAHLAVSEATAQVAAQAKASPAPEPRSPQGRVARRSRRCPRASTPLLPHAPGVTRSNPEDETPPSEIPGAEPRLYLLHRPRRCKRRWQRRTPQRW